MARIYLAARYGRRAEMQNIARALEAFGHLVTARWVRGAHEAEGVEQSVQFALEDLQDVEAADTLVAFTELPGTTGKMRGGRHVEFGYALKAGHRCIVVGPRENVFHHVPGVEVVPTVAQLFKLLNAELAQEVPRAHRT